MNVVATPLRPRGQYRADPLTAVTKRCPECAEVKLVGDFHRNKAAPDGRQSYCRVCAYTRNKEQRLAYQKRRLATPEGKEAHARAMRNWGRKHRHGVSLQEYEDMLRAQGGRCATCPKEPFDGPYGALYVDHCHETDRIRGLLCRDCNLALGHVRDDVARLKRLIVYLERQQ